MSAAEMLALRKEQLEAELAKTEKTVRRRKRMRNLVGRKKKESNEKKKNFRTHSLALFLLVPQLVSQIYDLESKYLSAEYSHAGTVLKVRN